MNITARATTFRRALFATLGVFAVALGIIGVFVPGLPTTEFIIAASYLFARSSPRLEGWLEGNRWFGPVLRRFRETGGMARKTKALALAWTWSGLSISLYVLAASGIGIQLFVLTMGLVGTVTILFVVRTTAARQPLILS
ncbi:MAG TPA: YbaN family protein [Vicinamibacterales bacterium]|nr:YbaN family protein [Vicinamibacterales bacterium]